MVCGQTHCQTPGSGRGLQLYCPTGSNFPALPGIRALSCNRLLLHRRCTSTSSSYASTVLGSSSSSSSGWQQTINKGGRNSLASNLSGSSCNSIKWRHPQHRCTARASASGSAAGDGSSSSSSGGSSGLLGMLQRWNQDTRKLREQLQSLGLAGVVAYGLFNTLYYTVAFLVVWFTVANVPAGLGAPAAMRKAAEVFALVWAGSQVTKLLRAAGALAFAPAVDKGLELAVQKFRLKSKQQAFALVVAACLAFAAAVFGAVVAVHM